MEPASSEDDPMIKDLHAAKWTGDRLNDTTTTPPPGQREPFTSAREPLGGREAPRPNPSAPVDFPLGDPTTPLPYVFSSPAMKDVVRMAHIVAGCDAPVLLTGESGTGKEVVAELIHSQSTHASGPFLKVNCAALPRELIESELFGAVRGAYTGSHENRPGLFTQAENGTLLLDEITEMPLEAQAKLLRVLQDRRFRPLASRQELQVHCRIIASTNRPPDEAIREHILRLDLYYRLSVVTIHIPPLRDRPEDIPPLVQRFISRFGTLTGRQIKGITPAAVERLLRLHWPGNVRQLENEVHRAVLFCHGDRIDLNDLSPPVMESELPQHSAKLAAAERRAISEALETCGGNKVAASRLLGVSRQTIYNKLHEYALESASHAPSDPTGFPPSIGHPRPIQPV
jgi:transcriptional regulator with PAS, ATPase and Fis domain